MHKNMEKKKMSMKKKRKRKKCRLKLKKNMWKLNKKKDNFNGYLFSHKFPWNINVERIFFWV
jgi:hypothetical protein